MICVKQLKEILSSVDGKQKVLVQYEDHGNTLLSGLDISFYSEECKLLFMHERDDEISVSEFLTKMSNYADDASILLPLKVDSKKSESSELLTVKFENDSLIFLANNTEQKSKKVIVIPDKLVNFIV